MTLVDGVGPDAPIVTNEKGGQQSGSPYRLDLLPPIAALEVAKITKKGAEKYAPWNWHLIRSEDHLNHMLQHAFAFIAGDTSEGGDPIEHARHAVCRAMFWLETLVLEQKAREGEPRTRASEDSPAPRE